MLEVACVTVVLVGTHFGLWAVTESTSHHMEPRLTRGNEKDNALSVSNLSIVQPAQGNCGK